MQKQTILFAASDYDDEDLVLLAIERADLNADIVVLRDGEAVVDFFLGIETSRGGSRRNSCDLLLLDLALPKLDGLKVLRQLRWLYRSDLSRLPPVVVLSAAEEADIVAEAYRHGASGFLCTMTPVSRFVAAVQQVLEYWLCTIVRPPRTLEPRKVPAPVVATRRRDGSQSAAEIVLQ